MAILAISLDFRSGGQEVATQIGEALGYKCSGKDQSIAFMKTAGERWERLFRELDQERPSLWDRYDWEYRGFVALLEAYIYEHASRDKAIVIGQGGSFVLQDLPFVLKVRLTAPFETRVRRLMEKAELGEKAAEDIVKRTDKARVGYVKAIYGKDWFDLKNYDMVFNAATQSYEQISKIIIDALRAKDQAITPDTWDILVGRTLAARIKARILTNQKIHVPTLAVTYDGQKIVIQGVVHNKNEYRVVEETAVSMSEGRPLGIELHGRG
jgi:cytidylate kinase